MLYLMLLITFFGLATIPAFGSIAFGGSQDPTNMNILSVPKPSELASFNCLNLKIPNHTNVGFPYEAFLIPWPLLWPERLDPIISVRYKTPEAKQHSQWTLDSDSIYESSHWTRVPCELWHDIFSYLGHRDFLRLSQTCKFFETLLRTDAPCLFRKNVIEHHLTAELHDILKDPFWPGSGNRIIGFLSYFFLKFTQQKTYQFNFERIDCFMSLFFIPYKGLAVPKLKRFLRIRGMIYSGAQFDRPIRQIKENLSLFKKNTGTSMDSTTDFTLKSVSYPLMIPPELGLLTHLTRLRIGCGRTPYLPESIGCLTNLTELNIGSSSFDDPCLQLEMLPQSFTRLVNLTDLNLSHHNFRVIPQLSTMTKITTLNLRQNPDLSDIWWQGHNLPTSLRTLDISYLDTDFDHHKQGMAIHLIRLTNLTNLALSVYHDTASDQWPKSLREIFLTYSDKAKKAPGIDLTSFRNFEKIMVCTCKETAQLTENDIKQSIQKPKGVEITYSEEEDYESDTNDEYASEREEEEGEII